MLSFRQPGDMARYVADNDPGQIAAGFSNLEDFLAAGNKIPEYKMGGREPLLGVSQDIFGAPNILTPLNPKSGAQQATPSTPNTESFSQDVLRDSDGNPLTNFTPIRSPGLPQPTDPVGILDPIRTVNPIVSGPQGFDDRLTKIEEGIASLLQNRGQQFNFGMQPRFDFGMQPRFNMSGLGYFFNPQGGFYG